MGSHTILAEFLKEHGVDARIIFFEEHVKTVAAAAKRLGVGPERIIKSVLFIDDRGGPVLAIVRGDRRVSEFRLAKMIGVRSVRIATPEETRIHTGYDVGAVPPVGLRPGLRVVIDAEVMRLERVYGGGGSGNALVEISPSDIQRLTGGVVGEIVVPT
ncbi:MAG: YbaK/EbsC family protein [Nitrososphaerota archaeon]|nr:YbaK/EbsC family protein [Candidatus Calditenuaceae archaeon]MDW8073815.1 YbaK/EbsC family protein [Nitrososphaerota archaeon]